MTKRRSDFPVVVLVGGSDNLAHQCREAVTRLGAVVKQCDLHTAATIAAKWHPLAIVLPQEVYAFDPVEFDALAKDVRTQVVLVPAEGITSERLNEALNSAAMMAQLRRRDAPSEDPEPRR